MPTPQSIKPMALGVAAGYVSYNLIAGNLAPLFFLANLRVSQSTREKQLGKQRP